MNIKMTSKIAYWILGIVIFSTFLFAYGWEYWILIQVEDYFLKDMEYRPRKVMPIAPLLCTFLILVFNIIVALIFFSKNLRLWGAWLVSFVFLIGPFYFSVWRTTHDIDIFDSKGSLTFLILALIQIIIAIMIKLLFYLQNNIEKS
jgi:small-conductance mechanosensitive channel